MKKLALLPLLFTLAILACLAWFFVNIKPVSDQLLYVNFNVPVGANAAQIGTSLYREGLIRNPEAFKIYVRFSRIASGIQAGDYRLSPSFSLSQIVDQLTKSPIEVKVTIPEGLRLEEIAAKFAKSLDQKQTFVSKFLSDSKGDEGYLFPDTYLVSNNATPGAIIAKMKANFVTKTDSLVPSGTDLSNTQIITLASIIERETKSGEERPVVAGILMNRLRNNMPLQVDATVQYAIGTSRCKNSTLSCSWWEPLASADLSINSAFNTYLNQGLPPAPIANPGLSAIKAAYGPSPTDYVYYIHDPQGNIHYAKTLEEQNANIKAYLR